jgi:lipid-binding SYLF domain-containing protein
MPTPARFVVLVLGFATAVIVSMGSSPAGAASPEGIDSDAQAALQTLYSSTPAVKTLGEAAKGILVFPNIVRAGFIFGAQYGKGSC